MSELPDHVPPARVPEPKPSALGIVLRRASDGWELLFGRRAATSRFMPGYLAFPGGRFERADGEFYGEERLAAFLARGSTVEAAAVAAEVDAFQSGELADDVTTMVLVRR